MTLDVSEDGEVEYEEEYLYDPEEEGDGLRLLRGRMARIASEGEDEATEIELHLNASEDVPFESVQGILDAWRPVDDRAESVLVRLEDGRDDPYELFLEELDPDDDDVVRLIVGRDEADEEPELTFQLPEEDFSSPGALLEHLSALHAEGEAPRLLVVPHGELLLHEALPLLESLDDAGVEAVAIAAVDLPLRDRVTARWSSICDADWEVVYEFLVPDRREEEELETFLEGKEDHLYEDPELHEILDVRGNTAFASVTVVWEPQHEILRQHGEMDLSQELEMVETWKRVGGTWYWAAVARTQEFFEEHPDLED